MLAAARIDSWPNVAPSRARTFACFARIREKLYGGALLITDNVPWLAPKDIDIISAKNKVHAAVIQLSRLTALQVLIQTVAALVALVRVLRKKLIEDRRKNGR